MYDYRRKHIAATYEKYLGRKASAEDLDFHDKSSLPLLLVVFSIKNSEEAKLYASSRQLLPVPAPITDGSPAVEKEGSLYDLTIIGPMIYSDGLGRVGFDLYDALTPFYKINLIDVLPEAYDHDIRRLSKHQSLKIPYIRQLGNFKGCLAKTVITTSVIAGNDKDPGSEILTYSIADIRNATNRIIALSMIEGDHVPSNWVQSLNEYYDEVVVPSEHLVAIYKTCGVKIPITVIPIPTPSINKAIASEPTKYSQKQPFVFGISACSLPRKNLLETITAFRQAFPPSKNDIRLKVHIRADYGGGLIQFEDIARIDWRIVLSIGRFSEDEMQEWRRSIHCYLMVSSVEGFSLTPREMLAMGIPTIISNAHAHSIIVEEEGAIGISCHRKTKNRYTRYGNQGDEWIPDFSELPAKMVYVRNNYAEAQQHVLHRRRNLLRYSPERVAGMWKTLIDSVSVTTTTSTIVVTSDVSLVIPYYSDQTGIKNLLNSLMLEGNSVREIIIVNNNYGECGFLKSLSCEASLPITIVTLSSNLGFGQGINTGEKLATGELLLLINDDVILPENYVTSFVECFRALPDVGVLGGALVFPDGRPQFAGFYHQPGDTFPAIYEIPKTKEPQRIRAATGALMIIRKEDFEELGGFKKCYGLGYYEDVDLCFEVQQQLGKKVYLFTDKLALHVMGATFSGIIKERSAAEAGTAFMKQWAGRLGQLKEQWEGIKMREEIAVNYSREEKTQLATAIDWYHCIDLGDGVITKGCNSYDLTNIMGLPLDLRDMTVLDICAWDGVYSFACWRRGAKRVLATDSLCWSDKPFTDKLNLGFSTGRSGYGTLGTKQGFLMARNLLGADVEDQNVGPEDISLATVGAFDLVLLLGVVYHMKNPIQIMQNAWNVTKQILIVESHIDESFGNDTPVAIFYPANEIHNDATNWWGPNRLCLKMMLQTLDPTPSRIELVNESFGAPPLGRATFKVWK